MPGSMTHWGPLRHSSSSTTERQNTIVCTHIFALAIYIVITCIHVYTWLQHSKKTNPNRWQMKTGLIPCSSLYCHVVEKNSTQVWAIFQVNLNRSYGNSLLKNSFHCFVNGWMGVDCKVLRGTALWCSEAVKVSDCLPSVTTKESHVAHSAHFQMWYSLEGTQAKLPKCEQQKALPLARLKETLRENNPAPQVLKDKVQTVVNQ